MDKPHCSQNSPYAVEATAGKTYYWCACGLSKNQPICDGSHTGTGFQAKAWTAPESKTVFFCGCRRSKTPPLCDGSHAKP